MSVKITPNLVTVNIGERPTRHRSTISTRICSIMRLPPKSSLSERGKGIQMAEKEKERYINRDISWLEFNARVLGEAADRENPLLERLKFIAIFSSNLDEFYMVRMAGVTQQLELGYKHVYGDSGYVPAELRQQLDTASARWLPVSTAICTGRFFPNCRKTESPSHLEIHFEIEEGGTSQDVHCQLSSDSDADRDRQFASVSDRSESRTGTSGPSDQGGGSRERFAVLEVPSIMPRFIEVEGFEHKASFLTSEELIANNLDLLFNKCTILECSAFRITRDMDFSIDEESIADL